MPRVKRIPRNRRELKEEQWWELQLGPGRESAFGSEEERRAAWRYYGAAMLAEQAARRDRPGHRPWAFWRYEIGLEGLPEEGETAALRRLGLLEPWEEELLARWEAERARGGVVAPAKEEETE